jgi:NAD(P)-dependent dehydrogenase (short-subunit alcohol dehydrogenase family)
MSIFKNTIAIVTGGASGIGRALARDLARRGADVVLADVQIDAANVVAAEICDSGGKASAHYLDVADSEAVENFVARIAAEKGRLDYMFNNAGIAIFGEFRDFSSADWKRILDINVNGVFAGTAAAYAVMIRQGTGHIVNTASVAGLIPSPGFTAYCASKHAVVGLSTSLRAEAAEYGVKVSVICPGFIKTPMFDSKTVGMPKESESSARALRMAMAPEECAARVLEGVAKNKAVIPVTGHAKVLWALMRYFPGLVHALIRRTAKRLHQKRVEQVVKS